MASHCYSANHSHTRQKAHGERGVWTKPIPALIVTLSNCELVSSFRHLTWWAGKTTNLLCRTLHSLNSCVVFDIMATMLIDLGKTRCYMSCNMVWMSFILFLFARVETYVTYVNSRLSNQPRSFLDLSFSISNITISIFFVAMIFLCF